MKDIQALLFDCDGVIAETERDGHRVSFNQAFREAGLPYEWDAELYGELVRIAGGKERMAHYFKSIGREDLAGDEVIKKLHARKSEMYQQLCREGALPARPGVSRVVRAAHERGIKLAVCSTSKEDSVRALITSALGAEGLACFDILLAGDIVAKKKPAPDIYLMAAERLGCEPAHCLVIEDSAIGLAAAKAAGMRCLVTVSVYSKGEDFAAADMVVENLDAPEARAFLNM